MQHKGHRLRAGGQRRRRETREERSRQAGVSDSREFNITAFRSCGSGLWGPGARGLADAGGTAFKARCRDPPKPLDQHLWAPVLATVLWGKLATPNDHGDSQTGHQHRPAARLTRASKAAALGSGTERPEGHRVIGRHTKGSLLTPEARAEAPLPRGVGGPAGRPRPARGPPPPLEYSSSLMRVICLKAKNLIPSPDAPVSSAFTALRGYNLRVIWLFIAFYWLWDCWGENEGDLSSQRKTARVPSGAVTGGRGGGTPSGATGMGRRRGGQGREGSVGASSRRVALPTRRPGSHTRPRPSRSQRLARAASPVLSGAPRMGCRQPPSTTGRPCRRRSLTETAAGSSRLRGPWVLRPAGGAGTPTQLGFPYDSPQDKPLPPLRSPRERRLLGTLGKCRVASSRKSALCPSGRGCPRLPPLGSLVTCHC